MNKLKIIISGGGTGGHIFPAISIADGLKRKVPSVEILFVGAEKRMEMKRVPEAGYEIVGLPIAGFNRKNLFKNFKVLWMLNKSIRKAKKIIKDFNPDVVVGVGGYASGPLLKAAQKRGIPTLIQEQNSYPGVTNKLLCKKASVICTAYEDMDKFFPKDKIRLTGNPYRQNLLAEISKEEAIKYFELDPDKKTILIIGGSLGARQINNSFIKHIDKIVKSGLQVIWQAGELYFHDLFLEIPNRTDSKDVHLHAFLDRMDLAYKAADLVVSRAGAGSISEFSLLGKAVILVPSPNVAEDHQTKNAMALVRKEAAILIPDADAEKELANIALQTVNDAEKLKSLSENISKLAYRNSTEFIVNEIIELANNK